MHKMTNHEEKYSNKKPMKQKWAHVHESACVFIDLKVHTTLGAWSQSDFLYLIFCDAHLFDLLSKFTVSAQPLKLAILIKKGSLVTSIANKVRHYCCHSYLTA